MAQRKKILVIDDDHALVLSMKIGLEKAGYQVLEAFEGKTGLEIAAKYKPDLIVLDMEMPKMSGFSFCVRIMTSEGRFMYPVFALTERAALKKGFEGLDVKGVMTKPFEKESFLKEIQTAMTDERDKVSKASLAKQKEQKKVSVKRVLIVEDDEDRRMKIAAAQLEAGYTVEFAQDIEEAVEKATRDRPDLVMVKSKLKDSSGEAVIRRLREGPKTKDIRVILYTHDPPRLNKEELSSSSSRTSSSAKKVTNSRGIVEDDPNLTLEETAKELGDQTTTPPQAKDPEAKLPGFQEERQWTVIGGTAFNKAPRVGSQILILFGIIVVSIFFIVLVVGGDLKWPWTSSKWYGGFYPKGGSIGVTIDGPFRTEKDCLRWARKQVHGSADKYECAKNCKPYKPGLCEELQAEGAST